MFFHLSFIIAGAGRMDADMDVDIPVSLEILVYENFRNKNFRVKIFS